MDKILKILMIIKDYFLIAVIAFLLIVMQFKNNKIDKLTTEVNEKPKIEYVYNTVVDTLKIPAPKPKEIIKYKPGKDSLIYIPLDLTSADSAQIAEAYINMYNLFGETKIYDNILKDDSIAYIRILEEIQFNSIKNRNLIFQSRVPMQTITNTQHVYTTSLVGGLEAGLNGVEVGVGLITKRNAFYKVSYDPYNKAIEGGAYFRIFNFRHK